MALLGCVAAVVAGLSARTAAVRKEICRPEHRRGASIEPCIICCGILSDGSREGARTTAWQVRSSISRILASPGRCETEVGETLRTRKAMDSMPADPVDEVLDVFAKNRAREGGTRAYVKTVIHVLDTGADQDYEYKARLMRRALERYASLKKGD